MPHQRLHHTLLSQGKERRPGNMRCRGASPDAIVDNSLAGYLRMQFDDELLEHLVSRSTAAAHDVFGDFYSPLLLACAKRIQEWGRSEHISSSVHLSNVAESLLRSIMDACCQIGMRTLITAFQTRFTDLEQSKMGYSEFHAWLGSDEGRKTVTDRFPEMDRLLRLAAERRLTHATEALRHAHEDRRVLEEAFGIDGRVVSLVPGLGDPHRAGKTVCFMAWEGGETLVYKPQEQSCAQVLEDLCSLTDAKATFFGPVLPRTLVRPDHLWQERIEHTDINPDLGPAEYYRRFGRTAALLSMIGATDLHHENVIATAEGPVVIDIEALVSLPSSGAPEGAASLAREVESSVLNTMLFPVRFKGANLDVDLSAIGCVRPSSSRRLQTFQIVDAGSDQIKFEQISTVIEHGANVATIAGEHVDPRLYVEEVVAGFTEARERLNTHRTHIVRIIEQAEDCSVRHVVRPTYIYAKFLEASLHPAYLASRDDRVALLAKLPRRYRGVPMEASDAMQREETDALADLDVPFFDVEFDSRRLRSEGWRPVGADAQVSETPRSAALTAVQAFFGRPSGRDGAYIRFALASSVDDVWEDRRPSRHRDGRCDNSSRPRLSDAPRWHESIRELVVEGNEEPSWLTLKLDGDGLRLGSVDVILHEGGGLMLYLVEAEHHDRLFGTGIDIGRAYSAATLEALPAFTTPQDYSPFTGALSSIITGLELRGRGASSARVPQLDTAGGGRDHEAESLMLEDFDYLNGYGGYLANVTVYGELADLTRIGPSPGALLRRLMDLEQRSGEHQGPLGLAHGRLGRMTALSGVLPLDSPDGRTREYLNDFASAYLRHRWTDSALSETTANSGWCKGYAGVAFALVKLLQAVGCSRQSILDAIGPEVERIASPDFSEDISFCHGMAGRLAILCWLADRLEWPELRSEAGRLQDAFLERYDEGGWSYGIGARADLSSFMYGWSGWHYARLMIDHPGTELPRCLGDR